MIHEFSIWCSYQYYDYKNTQQYYDYKNTQDIAFFNPTVALIHSCNSVILQIKEAKESVRQNREYRTSMIKHDLQFHSDIVLPTSFPVFIAHHGVRFDLICL